MASKPIQAAGGIVVRSGARALIAVVQRSKDDAWVLPRGKIKRNENPVSGARREVVEETGHRVEVHEFLGAITYRARGRPKVVQFWRMEAEPKASHELMADITAVEWLPLKAAVRRLSYPLEKLFLRNIGRRAMAGRGRAARAKLHKPKRKKSGKKPNKKSAKKTGTPARAKSSSAKPKAKNKPKKKSHQRHVAPRAPKSKPRIFAVVTRRTSTRPLQKSNQAAPKRSVPVAAGGVQGERAIASIAAIPASVKPVNVTPIDAAKNKSILKRMLGRLAG